MWNELHDTYMIENEIIEYEQYIFFKAVTRQEIILTFIQHVVV